MGLRRAGLIAVAALAACDFPRPADVGPGAGDGGLRDGAQTGDGAQNGDGPTGTPMLGQFATFGAGISHARSFHGHAVLGNRLTLFTGVDASATPPTSIEQSTIGANNDLGQFGLTSSSVADPGTGQGVAVIGTEVFLVGGESGTTLVSSDQIQAAPTTGGNTVGSFSFISPTLVTSRDGNGLVVTSKFMYVIGGEHIVTGSTSYLSSTERASITSGSPGAFSTVSGVSLGTARGQFALVHTGQFVYVIGGTNGSSSALDSVERAPINSDGTLGLFAQIATVTLTGRRFSHSSAVLGNYVYAIGGSDGTSQLGTVDASPLD